MSATATLTLRAGHRRTSPRIVWRGARPTSRRRPIIASPPPTPTQIAEILRFAHARPTRRHARSAGGTKLGWGNPVAADIDLNLTRLNALRDHAWQDMTCTVEAGCTWAAMQAELRRHGQMVALDPLWPERATVGGIVAMQR